ncbi:MAG: transaldolase family protein, partial [Spirochaetota bacterium]
MPAEQILGQRGREVVKQNYKSALHEMAETTPTDYWNDSCSIEELTYGIEHGAVGATSNPVIVYQVLQKEMPLWTDRIKRIIADNPGATEDEVAWIVIEQMALGAAKLLKPVYDAHGGLKGRLSIQTDPKLYRNTDRIVDQAVHFATVAENVHVKIPATKAGIAAIEEATAQGVNVNATVSFSVAQSIAVAEAVGRGLARREKAGADTSTMAPVCTIMVGRVDDWLKVVADKDNIITDPENLEWAGVAVLKNAYRIYRDRGYRTRLLAAAYRNHYQWSQLIGGDVVLTIPYKWAKRFNGSGMVV